MTDNLELAQKTFNKADRLLKIGLGVLVAFTLIVIIVTSIEVFSVQQTIVKNQKINSQASTDRFNRYTTEQARQEAITQQYIRCVASTLVIPIPNRDPSAFDNCSKAAQAQNLKGQPSTTPSP